MSAHFDDLESRFAFRTRLLDCFWADLPVVATAGDSLGDLVESRGLGRAVPPGDVAGVGRGARVAPRRRERVRARRVAAIAAVRDEFLWPRVVAPLRRLVRGAGRADRARRHARPPAASWIGWRVRHAVADRGRARRGAASHAARRGACRAPEGDRHR